MARNEPDDIDALLAEVDRSLSPTSAATPARRQGTAPARTPTASPAGDSDAGLAARAMRRLIVSLVAGALCAGLVFALFLFTPFTGAISGALGAGLAGFTTALLLPRRL